MSTTDDTNLLIVEDNPLIAADIQSFLQSEGFKIVGIAHDGVEALDMLASRKPNIVILDIHLGTGMSGLEIGEVIHDKYNIPFIFLTSFDDEKTLSEAQQHSPFGYIVKPFQERTLITTIKLALSNYNKVKQADIISKVGIEQIFDCKITDQELKIINALVQGKSYKAIALEIFVTQNTIKYHVKNIYRKLKIKGRSELASKLL